MNRVHYKALTVGELKSMLDLYPDNLEVSAVNPLDIEDYIPCDLRIDDYDTNSRTIATISIQ